MTAPLESPPSENALDLEVRSNTAISLENSLGLVLKALRRTEAAATLENHGGRVTPVVDILGFGITHLGVGKDTVEPEKAVRRIFE